MSCCSAAFNSTLFRQRFVSDSPHGVTFFYQIPILNIAKILFSTSWLSWERFRCNTDCENDPDNCIRWVSFLSHFSITLYNRSVTCRKRRRTKKMQMTKPMWFEFCQEEWILLKKFKLKFKIYSQRKLISNNDRSCRFGGLRRSWIRVYQCWRLLVGKESRVEQWISGWSSKISEWNEIFVRLCNGFLRKMTFVGFIN